MLFSRTHDKVMAGLAAALLMGGPAAAAVVYDHGPVNGRLAAQFIHGGFFTANAFTLAAPITFDGIAFGVWDDRAGPIESFDWSIATGPTLGNPTIVASGHATDLTFTETNIPGSGYGFFRVRSVSFATGAVTLAAQTWWLRLSTPTQSLVGWDQISTSGLAEQGIRGIGSGPQPGSNSFQLTGAAVPEPASWALMLVGFGLGGAALRARRRLRPIA